MGSSTGGTAAVRRRRWHPVRVAGAVSAASFGLAGAALATSGLAASDGTARPGWLAVGAWLAVGVWLMMGAAAGFAVSGST
ncbi:MAG TPA: hypothetical protein VLJ59_09645 [Mycobacteriales bacterium]|nr:hypothetical protein [Mycobacteriales bacterium]